MAARPRSRRRHLDDFARRSPLHAAVVGLVRFLLPIALALAIGYALVAASPFLGELLAEAMLNSTR